MFVNIMLVVTIPLNILMIIVAFWLLSRAYRKRFDMLVNIVSEAMAERDAKHQRLKAMVAHAVVTDTTVFDTMLGDEEELDAIQGQDSGRSESPTGDNS